MHIIRSSMMAAGIAFAAAAFALPASAAPVSTTTAVVKETAQNAVTDVRSSRRWRYRRGYGSRHYGYYGPRYYRGYRGGYAYRGGYPPQECVFDEGQGRFRPCSMGPR